MTSLHQRLNQECVHERESAVERLHLRWSSSSRVIVDRSPSQQLSRRQMSQGRGSGSVKDNNNDPVVGDAHRRRSAFGRLQQSDSKWTSGSEAITDRPPLQPLSCRGSAIGRVEQSGSRWVSGSRASISALEHSFEMNNHDVFESAVRALCTLNLLRKPQSPAAIVTGTGSGLRIAAGSA